MKLNAWKKICLMRQPIRSRVVYMEKQITSCVCSFFKIASTNI